jgi:hypothetical protein
MTFGRLSPGHPSTTMASGRLFTTSPGISTRT